MLEAIAATRYVARSLRTRCMRSNAAGESVCSGVVASDALLLLSVSCSERGASEKLANRRDWPGCDLSSPEARALRVTVLPLWTLWMLLPASRREAIGAVLRHSGCLRAIAPGIDLTQLLGTPHSEDALTWAAGQAWRVAEAWLHA